MDKAQILLNRTSFDMGTWGELYVPIGVFTENYTVGDLERQIIDHVGENVELEINDMGDSIKVNWANRTDEQKLLKGRPWA